MSLLQRTTLALLLIATPSIGVLELASTKTPYTLKYGDPLPENTFVELAKKINPTVVNISVIQGSQGFRRRGGPPPNDPFWEFFEQFMGPPGAVPRERRGQSIGTGFIIDPSGLIVTNSHVIRGATEVEVQLIGEDEKFYPAEIVGDDPRFDIALIKVDAGKNLPFAELGDSDKVEVGEWVAAFGNPYGHTFSVSKGIISAKQRQITELSPIPFLQTDASINPGNSGGPLVNTQGQVIGVNTAIDARAQGIGFAIPINELKKIRPQLEKVGRVLRGFIGVSINDISLRAKEALKLKDLKGALIMDVQRGGPADKGGIEPYDVVTKFNSAKIASANDLVNAVKDTAIGKKAKVSVIRNGKSKTLSVTVGKPPGETIATRRLKPKTSQKGRMDQMNLGMRVSNGSSQLRKEFNVPSNAPKGPIVTEVRPNGPAWMAGLRPGDILIDVNRKRVTQTSSVFKNLKKGDNLLRVYNSGRVNLIFLKIR